MIGPKKRGHWTNNPPGDTGKPFGMLLPGEHYKVIKAFTNYDGDTHPVNEQWKYISHSFLPHDDGLSLFVSLDDKQEWHIRMQWRQDEQKEILERTQNYIAKIGEQSNKSL